MQTPILKGTVYITDNLNIVMNVPDNSVRVIALDEGEFLNPNDPNVIVGSCLLPPPEALIAEVDGDEDLYNLHYMTHFNNPYNQQFIAALIGALYQGTSLLLFTPKIKDNFTIVKLREMFWGFFGIKIGIAGVDECVYDQKCIPIWLNMIFLSDIISPNEYLIMYPSDAKLDDNCVYKVITILHLYGSCQKDRYNAVERFRKRLKSNNNTKQAIFDIRGR